MFKNYKWSNWCDINTGAFSNHFYLLQARRRNDGKVEFRVEESKACFSMKQINLSDLEKVRLSNKFI
jgi:hypothetical protein